jgi:hypothetical protein
MSQDTEWPVVGWIPNNARRTIKHEISLESISPVQNGFQVAVGVNLR